ncbi:hypothetical protein JAAARDRAFT_416287 [Jaapia argillacea MUCL 33604]|uniref:Uncharacterized protein n=1 Tax=Jaapia argillacea MUCL 33604 TaxID=933084 RepID=A0A067PU99_9AGAM|nr:hypothetical protein JAAARDRAFT_416287 [Jaapia argillacea MUCL 33604]
MFVHPSSQLFRREALMWFALSHENVVPLIGLVMNFEGPHPALISPYLENGNLLAYVNNNHLSVDRVNSLLRDVAAGLEYVHERQIVHGDLRAVNVLVDGEDRARLSDFGLAYIGDMTRSSAVRGNWLWIAPELHDPSATIYERTSAQDVYSFGMVCIEVYTGEAPYAGVPEPAAFSRIRQGVTPDRPTSHTGGRAMSNELWRVVQLCWTFRPNDRPSICRVLEELRKCPSEEVQGDSTMSRSATLRPLTRIQNTPLATQANSLPFRQGSAEVLTESPTWITSTRTFPPSAQSVRLDQLFGTSAPQPGPSSTPSNQPRQVPRQVSLPPPYQTVMTPPVHQYRVPSSPPSGGPCAVPPVSSTTSSNALSEFNRLAAQHKVKAVFKDSSTGPGHQLHWTVRCFVNGVERGSGSADNKREASETAAAKAMVNLGWGGGQSSSSSTLTAMSGKAAIKIFNERVGQPGVSGDFAFEQSGPPHLPVWQARCIVNGVTKGHGRAVSKQLAKEEAAKEACRAMGWAN